MNSPLEEVARIKSEIDRLEAEKRQVILSQQGLKHDLDTAMVAAVDWGGCRAQDVAELAGYKSHSSAIRDARRRVNERGTEVR